mgnify:CR=1 FL=1
MFAPQILHKPLFSNALGTLHIPKSVWIQWFMQNLGGKQSVLWGMWKWSMNECYSILELLQKFQRMPFFITVFIVSKWENKIISFIYFLLWFKTMEHNNCFPIVYKHIKVRWGYNLYRKRIIQTIKWVNKIILTNDYL